VTVPINTASRGAQLAHILANSQAKLLVLQVEFADAVNSLDIAQPSLGAIRLIGVSAAQIADTELGQPRDPGICGATSQSAPAHLVPFGA
jgi:hypothetical protein